MAEKKITLRFRLWWLRHKNHLIVTQPLGGGWCAKCKIVAPKPFKEG